MNTQLLFKRYLVTVAIFVLLFSLVFLLFNPLRQVLIQEDTIIENLTVLVYVLTFVLGIVFLRKKRSSWLYIFSFLGLFGALEELSYGERLFGLSMPEINGLKIDSLHDFFQLGFTTFPVFFFVIFFGIVGTILYILLRKNNFSRMISEKGPALYLLILVILVGVALIIDLELVVGRSFMFLEEMLELIQSLTVLFGILSTRL